MSSLKNCNLGIWALPGGSEAASSLMQGENEATEDPEEWQPRGEATL